MIVIRFYGNIGAGSWDSADCPVKLADYYRPPVELSAPCTVLNRQTARCLIAKPNGTITVANMGGTGSDQTCFGTLCIPVP